MKGWGTRRQAGQAKMVIFGGFYENCQDLRQVLVKIHSNDYLRIK
jgi:hypothetical protein